MELYMPHGILFRPLYLHALHFGLVCSSFQDECFSKLTSHLIHVLILTLM
uniref:Uncharacterized protein n=1 Tax=Arundo donax TaxID=35708 RepID=A0A0A9C9D8_ARUDO